MKIRHLLSRSLATIALPVTVYLVFFIVTRMQGNLFFGNSYSWRIILQNTIYSVLIAYGIAINLGGGRFDFSAGAIAIMAAVFGYNVNLIINGNTWTLLIIVVLFGMGFSGIVGSVYLLLKLPIVIVSLGMVIIYEAITGIAFGGNGITAYTVQSITVWAKPPMIYVLLAIGMICFYIYNTHTTTSYRSRALSFNQEAAVSIGIDEKVNIGISYLASGFFIGLGAVIYLCTTRITAASNLSSTQVMFMNFPPVIIGLYLRKFCNEFLALFVGALTVSILMFGTVALGYDASMQQIIFGVFLVLFSVVSSNEAKIANKFRQLLVRHS